MSTMIQAQATAIGNRLSATDNVAFPIALIVPIAEILLQLLGQCWKAAPPAGLPGSANPAEYVSDHYDPATDTFEDSLLGQVRGQTRRAIRMNARNNGGQRLRDMTQDQVTQVSIESLKQVMNTPQAMSNCLLEVNV